MFDIVIVLVDSKVVDMICRFMSILVVVGVFSGGLLLASDKLLLEIIWLGLHSKGILHLKKLGAHRVPRAQPLP